MNNLRQRKAFTIVEMVIVIAVIAILAAVLIPTISTVIEKANVSADQQFAASLNVQLAMWEVDNGTIKDESDLRDAINYYYGEWEDEEKTVLKDDGDFYATLEPKSGKYGFSYWYDAENRQVILKDYNGLTGVASSSLVVDAAGKGDKAPKDPASFSDANPRSIVVDGKRYFVMDHKKYKDDDEVDLTKLESVGEIIYRLETMKSAQNYEDLVNRLEALANDEDNKDKAFAKQVYEKIQVTAIVTEFGIFRHSAASVEYVYIPITTKLLANRTVYEYKDGKVDDGTASAIATSNNLEIELPRGVKINMGVLTGFANGDDDSGLLENTVELHVNADLEDLKDIFEAGATDCVIVLPDGSRYIMVGSEIYRLPREDGDTPAVEGLTMTSIDKIEIKYEDANSNLGGDGAYFYDNTLYMAYDLAGAQLSLVGGVPESMVEWTVSANAPIEVSGSGKVTVKGNPDYTKTEATVTATLKSDSSKTDSINVQLIFPTKVNWELGGVSHGAPATTGGKAIEITYEEATQFAIAYKSSNFAQSGSSYVTMVDNDLKIKFTTSGDLFKIETGKLILDPTKIESTPDGQTLTVTYGTDKITYITETYTITVVDNSASPFDVNDIVSGVKMGETYLFRVGNGNAFALNKLFKCDKAPANVTLAIYNAASTDGNNNRAPIATSGSGFKATYTSALTKDTWANSTIQFSGTGVAIIEITTNKGSATLAVEVVNGKNVTSAGDFSGATNYVVLNDIAWGSTTSNTSISGTIYGNGFAINAQLATKESQINNALFYLSGGTIDNLMINGPVYPELVYQTEASSSKPYYVMGVYTQGDATITNSYISGFRSPIMADGESLYLENTTLVGGNYANLWLQAGKLTLKDVTTVQKETNATVGDTSKKVLGAGVITNSSINAADVTVIGNLTQYNWVSKSQASSYMDSDVSSLINTFFNNSTIAHTVGGTPYINSGIVFQGTTGTVNNASQTAGHGYSNQPISGNLLGVKIEGLVYTRTTTSGTIASVPTYGGYTPNAQSVLNPTFKHNVTLTDGVVNLKLANGSATLNLPNYTVSKYSGQSIAVNITCSGATVSGNTITFSKDGNYTVTYTVVDNWFFDIDGTKYDQSISDTYNVTVVVTKAEHKDAVIDVSGVDKTIYYGLVGTTTDPDYEYCFAVLSGLKITDYNEDGSSVSVTVPANSLPSGLTVTASHDKFTKVEVQNGKYYLVDSVADNNRDQNYGNITIKYQYTGKNGKTVTATVAHSITANCTATQAYKKQSSGGCVTPDTLITLADGTQKQIQHVTYDDMLLVWNHYTGEYAAVPSAIIFNHGYDNNTVIKLNFSDGTQVKAINLHQFLDADLKKYVTISADTVADYVGHNFVKQDGDSYKTVTLESYEISEEYIEAYGIISALHYNILVEGMFSTDFMLPDYDLFNYFTIGEGMVYDEAQMQEDIEKYGLYTYDDFADYLTYEQFVGFNVQYFKIAVGRGLYTYDGILDLINEYLNA